MSDEVTKLTEKLSKLSVRRSQIIAELQEIDREHTQVEKSIEDAKLPKSELVGSDAKGNSLRVGDTVTTLTRGKYYERIAEVSNIKPDNHVDITYKSSKKGTWRAGHNLLRLQ